MNIPLVSVIMPVHNGSRYLNESIESILTQTYSNIEFIIINDGSSDKTKDILISYTDTRIILIHNETNIGLNKSLNIGIMRSNGKYIVRMDSDDISFPERILEQVNFMENNPNCILCGTNCQIIDSENQIIKISDNYLNKYSNEIKASLFFTCPIVHPSVCVRSSILFDNNIFYNEDIKQAEDYVLYTKIFPFGDFINLDIILLKYRIHNNDSRITAPKNFNDIYAGRIVAWNILFEYLNLNYPCDLIYSIHNKLAYNSEALSNIEILYLNEYFEFLINMKNQNNKQKVFDVVNFNHNIAKKIYGTLLLFNIPMHLKIQLFLKYCTSLSFSMRIKYIIKFQLFLLSYFFESMRKCI